MGIPNNPSSQDLASSMTRVGKSVKTYRVSLTGSMNWRGKIGTQTIPNSAFKKLSRAAQFFREGYYSLEDIKQIKDQGNKVKDVANAAKQSTTKLEKINKLLFKKVPGGEEGAASRAGAILGILSLIGLTLLLKLQEEMLKGVFDNFDVINRSAEKTLTLISGINNKVKAANEKIKKFERELKVNAEDYRRLNKQQGTFGKTITEAKKQANDALYETREGRKIVEGKITEAKKQSNDALYETRKGREILEKKIDANLSETAGVKKRFESQYNELKSSFDKYIGNLNTGFQSKIETAIRDVQKSLELVKITSQKTQEQVSLQKKAIDAASQFTKILPASLNTGFKAIQDTTKKVLEANIAPIRKSTERWGVTITPATITPATVTVSESGGLTVTPSTGGVSQVTYADFSSSDIAREINQKEEQQDNQIAGLGGGLAALANGVTAAQSTANTALREAQIKGTSFVPEITALKGDIDKLKVDIKVTTTDLTKVDTKLKEQEKVNQQALPKLDQIVGLLGLIPARSANAIRPDIPTIPQIETAAATGTCRTTQPGGCMSKALKDNAADITKANDSNASKILDRLNLGANAAEYALLKTIDKKLGDQVLGGISGFMNRITKNQWIDRSISLVTMAAAVHNVVMLSDQAATTFFSILDNVLAIPALIIDPNADTIDTKQAFGGLVDNFFKNIFGVSQWAEIKAKWATANRIYQAAANAANEVRSIGGNIISAVEQTAQLTGKGFNAMQDEGLLSEANWDYSPERLKLKGGLFAKFGKLADGITIATEGLEAIESITSEVRSAVDSANQIKENAKEVDDGVKELFNQSKTKREEEVEALPPKTYSWEDLI